MQNNTALSWVKMSMKVNTPCKLSLPAIRKAITPQTNSPRFAPRSGKRYGDALAFAQERWIYRHRTPAEAEYEQHYNTDNTHLLERIQSKVSGVGGSIVAALFGRPGVAEFMYADRKTYCDYYRKEEQRVAVYISYE